MKYLQHLLKHITAKHLAAITLVSTLALQTHAQNVGVGVDTPQTRLHVAGTLLTDSLRLPSGARDGYLLKSDSLGNGFWAPVLGKNLGPTLRDAHQFVNTQPEYIEIQGNLAYVACDNIDSLLAFDLSDPSLPVRIGGIRILFGGAAQGLVVAGDRAYADYGNLIQTIDISDPTNPVSVNILVQSGEDMAYHNGYLYVVGNAINGLVVIDAQTPDTLIVVDTIGIGGDPNGIAIEGNHAFIIDAGSLDMKVFDLTNPESPALVGSTLFGSFPTFIEVKDGFAYVTDNGTDTLYIFDISVPSSPQIVATVGGFSVQNGLKAHNQLLYMSDSDLDSLYVFDISDPYAPCLLGTKPVPSLPTRMDARGDYIYLLNEGPDRIEVFHIAQNLVTADLKGGMQPFDGQLPGLVTIGSNNFMEHLRLNRIGVGGVHLTATNPHGFLVAADNGDRLLFADAMTGAVGIGTDDPGDLIPNTKLEVDQGHITLSSNFGVLSVSGDTSGIGAGFDTGLDDALYFWSGAQQRMTISPEGHVGIGPSATPKLLSLRAPDDTLSGPILQFTGTGTDQFESGRIRFVEGSEPNHRGGYIHYDGFANRFHIGVHDENGAIMSDDYNAITIHRETGQVGIGNENPLNDLDIFDSHVATLSLQDTNTQLLFTTQPTQATIQASGLLRFFTNNIPRVTINHLGLVGIGDNGPQFPLVVKDDVSENTGLGGLVKFENSAGIMFLDGDEIDATQGTLFLQNNVTHGVSLAEGGGNVGIGVSPASEKLTVAGTIHSTSGGIKFPDGTTQVSSGWSLAGNGGTGGTGFLGTTDAQPFELRTNNATRLHITAAGDVGIGMTSPASRLHLDGDDNNGTTATLQIESGAQTLLLDGNEIDAITDDLHLQNNSAQNVILVNGGGMVGIGTSSPDRELTVYSPSSTVINIKDDTRELFLGVNSSGGSLRTLSNDELSFWTNNARHMTIETSGEVGIGTSNPTALLEVNAATVKKVGGGSWTASSDIRLKQDIRDYRAGLEDILRIRPVRFRYNALSGYDTSDTHVGVVAQELQEVAPNMVSSFDKDGETYLEVDNSDMIYMLINAVKEQQTIISNMKKQQAQLMSELQSIKQVLSEVEKESIFKQSKK